MSLLLAAFVSIPDPLPSHPASGQPVAAEGDENSTEAGVIVASEIVELWLPEALRELETPTVRAGVLESPDGLRSFLDRPGNRVQPPAVTIRCRRGDGRPCDYTQILRPLEVPDHLRMLRAALDNLDDRAEGVADSEENAAQKVHALPDGLLDRDQEEILTELDRIRDEEAGTTR